LTISQEERLLLEKASDYQILVSTAGWRRLLDFLASYSDQRLAAIRLNTSSDPAIKASLSDRWVISEKLITDIQNEVLGAIEDKNQFISEVLKQNNTSLEEFLKGGTNEQQSDDINT
jgi:hypothetical protein